MPSALCASPSSALRVCRLTPVPIAFLSLSSAARKARRCWRARSAEGETEPSPPAREQRRLLERLFRSPDDDEEAVAAPAAADPAIIASLPLWRVQWVALPGYQSVLHVHVPHYCDMFERLLSGPRPWRFGHLLLPGGSRNLGSEEYALAPGSQAPLVGTLMEVLQAVRFPDGRLLVLAAGLSRIRVARVRQTVPHGVADVALLPDWEEAEAQHAVAASALCPDAAAAHQDPEQHLQQEDGVGSEGLATTSARRARAAAAAAAAETSAWQEYELSGARVVDRLALVDGSDAQEAQAFGRQLVAISNNEYLPLPYWTSVLAAAASGRGRSGSPGAGVAPSSRGEWGEEVARELQDATAAAAAAAATAAEAAVAASGSAAFSSGWDVWPPGAWPHPPPGLINSTAERGVPWHPPSGVLADSEEEQEQQELAEAGPSGSVAVLLERRVWRELATISGLLHKVHGKTLQLSEGLHCLQPPPDADGASLLMSELGDFGADDSSSEADKDEGGPSGRLPAVELPPGWAHPAYPALRRAQRLSYALANLLPTFSGSEARQALLEAGSTAARLRMIVAGLRVERNKLAAVAVLNALRRGQ